MPFGASATLGSPHRSRAPYYWCRFRFSGALPLERIKADRLINYNRWTRRESNPGPQGLQFTFVHVRSRRIPVDWVREFGHDLFLANLGHTIEDALAQPSSSG